MGCNAARTGAARAISGVQGGTGPRPQQPRLLGQRLRRSRSNYRRKRPR